MTKIVDYIVQEYDPDECGKALLHKPSADVDMKKFRTSPFYRQLIMDVVNYMDAHLNMKFEDYPDPRGVSGVTLAIPWNIIGYKHRGSNKFCINPKIIRLSKDGFETETNCPSFRLEKQVKVFRHAMIDLDYYDLRGQKVVEKNIGRFEGSFTIQHEVDHCLGLCILDKEIK